MNKKIGRVFLLLVLMLSLTGCTKTLTDVDKKGVKNPVTGQTLTENILCRPTNEDVIELYKEKPKEGEFFGIITNVECFAPYYSDKSSYIYEGNIFDNGQAYV